ncbi:MAG: diguanylate cyclase [Spirochaetales bacterium]|uniref:diguanylate cyclase n=1 Tax=Candidatus Thalassospirochaeta sargassi TaxID=3119039 RepID=A0AAJ1MPK8_9SPIO|nr:diguanylate cyclase [Spirochaetales bacterium]
MSGISDKTTERLRALKEDYLKSLPNRYNQLKKAAVKLIEGDSGKDIITDFRMQVHKIAGSAATFSLDILTEEAKILEEKIDEIIQNGKAPDEASSKFIISSLKKIRSICSDPAKFISVPEDVVISDLSAIEEKKVVFVLGENDLISKDLSEQLGYFGYTVQVINCFSSLKEHIKQARNELLIMNSNMIENKPMTAAAVKKIKEDADRQLSIIFFSDKDNFNIRHECVKSGGDDFFTIPLDVSRLIDRVDNLTNDENTNPYHVLIVDDDPEQVSYYALVLQQAGMITSVASDPKKVLDILSESKPDLILMDMYMPDCDGPDLAAIIRQQEAFLSIPIVFLSFESNKEIQFEAISHGGDDFLTKPIKPDFLISSVTSKAERNRTLRYFMERDSLTGLLNHVKLKEALFNEVLRAERTEAELCFAMIDIDHFKQVNDVHGHMTGDRVLKSLSRLLQDRLRRTDIIGRYGGEEFAVILLNTDLENAEIIMNKIRESFAQIRHVSSEGDFYVTFSCGIACYPHIKSASDINSAADQALYKAKEIGRNRIINASELSET